MKKESILCYLLNSNGTFLAFVSPKHIEVRKNPNIFGFNMDLIKEEDVFRVTITTKPGSIHTLTEPATVNDWIWLNDPVVLSTLKIQESYKGNYIPSERVRLSAFINKIPEMAQQLRNDIIDNIINK